LQLTSPHIINSEQKIAEKYQLLHENMLADISARLCRNDPEIQLAESCFWIASDYCTKLKQMICKNGFLDEADEIDFFRNVKPEFTCYMEYFILMIEAILFAPDEKDQSIRYWEREATRLDRFCSKNNDFILYYEEDHHHMDNIFFLRSDIPFSQLVKSLIYDRDNNFCSSHDPLLRSYFANRMFVEYAKRKLEELRDPNSIWL
jgi:hypothetical protein